MRISIRNKILLQIFGIITVVIFGLCVYLNQSLTALAFSNLKSIIQKDALFAENYILARLDRKASISTIDPIVSVIGNTLDLRATFIDPDGNVLGDSELTQEQIKSVENHGARPEVVAALRNGSGEAKRYSSTIGEDFYYYAKQIEDNPYVEGVLRLSIKLSTVNAFSQKIKEVFVYGIIMSLALVFIFSYFATVYISNPIAEIADVAKNIADGDFNRHSHIQSNDEIGDLSKAVNHMSEQISMRIDEVSRHRSRLEAMFLSMFDGIMIVDNDGSIRLINSKLKSFIDFEGEPLGKKPLEVVRNIEIQEIIESILNNEERFLKREIQVLSPQEKTLLVHASIIERDDEHDGAALVFHDITEIRKLETMRRDFVANVSHELRTPITSILGYAETLSEGALKDPKTAEEFVNIIKIDAQRLNSLVNDILDLSKIESGKYEFKKEHVRVKDLINRVCMIMANQLNERGIKVSVDINRGAEDIIGDEFSLEQIFLNLLENAIKYNKENGVIEISADKSGDLIKFCVKDSGVGIPSEDLPRIFEKFYRVDKARSRAVAGTGLGLSIVKHLVQAHFGQVSVESRLNEGTVFTFTLPKNI